MLCITPAPTGDHLLSWASLGPLLRASTPSSGKYRPLMWDAGLKLTEEGNEKGWRRGKLLITFVVEDSDLSEFGAEIFLFRELQKIAKKTEDASPWEVLSWISAEISAAQVFHWNSPVCVMKTESFRLFLHCLGDWRGHCWHCMGTMSWRCEGSSPVSHAPLQLSQSALCYKLLL